MPILIADVRGVLRSGMEYPTEDVSFAYLAGINKLKGCGYTGVTYSQLMCYLTLDSFTDKAIRNWGVPLRYSYGICYLRYQDSSASYFNALRPASSTSDHVIMKSGTELASEAVDISERRLYDVVFSVSGSTLKSSRNGGQDFQISATDTEFSSGYMGAGGNTVCSDYAEPWAGLGALLLAPASSLPQARAVVETEVTGSGTFDDPFRPNMVRKLKEISQLSKLPEFLYREIKKYELLKTKGFTDEEIKLLLGNIQTHVDLASVAYGTFDHKPEHSTMLITIMDGNQYSGEKAIQEQIEHAKSKNLRVLKPPRDYKEAVEQYRQLKRDFPEWIAGKDNYAYQTLGHEDLEKFQVADTYYGNIVDGIKPDAYKRVPEWEMRRTLQMWKERLKKVTILKEEAEKHLKKLEEVEKKGW